MDLRTALRAMGRMGTERIGMPEESGTARLELELDESCDGVRIRYNDAVDLRKQLRLIDYIAGLHRQGMGRFVIDMRGRDIRLSDAEWNEAADHMRGIFGSGIAASFLVDPSVPAGIPEDTLRSLGALKVKVASSEDEARNWVQDA
jgi:hypothetical protein